MEGKDYFISSKLEIVLRNYSKTQVLALTEMNRGNPENAADLTEVIHCRDQSNPEVFAAFYTLIRFMLKNWFLLSGYPKFTVPGINLLNEIKNDTYRYLNQPDSNILKSDMNQYLDNLKELLKLAGDGYEDELELLNQIIEYLPESHSFKKTSFKKRRHRSLNRIRRRKYFYSSPSLELKKKAGSKFVSSQ